MDEKENFKTLKKLERLERGLFELDNPRSYLRTIAKRLVYLYKKQAALRGSVPRPSFLDDEVDALFWLLAQYAAATGYDVRAVLQLVKKNEAFD